MTDDSAAGGPPSLDRLRLDADALNAFLAEAFPQGSRDSYGTVVHVAPAHVRMALDPLPHMLRPGGIVSGPTQMQLADVAAYAVVLAHIGPQAMAVTNTLTMNFLRGCRPERITVDARLLKLGRRLATIEARLWQDREDRPVGQASIGYALP